MNHTQTPFVIREQSGEIQIWEDRTVAGTRHESCVAVMNGLPTEEARADAVFITSACNAHDQLIEYFNASTALANTVGHEEATVDDERKAEERFEAAGAAVRAALAAAGAA